jgi:hypothetical protein
VNGDAAGRGLPFDQGDALPEIRGLRGTLFAGRSGTDDDEVEAFQKAGT